MSVLFQDEYQYVPPARSRLRRNRGDSRPPISPRMKVAGIIARAVFLVVLVVIMAHVSAPQTSGSAAQAFESVGDLSRVVVGWGACLFALTQLFVVPKEDHEHRTWLVLGPALASLLAVCAVAWW